MPDGGGKEPYIEGHYGDSGFNPAMLGDEGGVPTLH